MLRLFNSSFFGSPLCSIVLSVVGVLSRMFITGFYVLDFFISYFQVSAAFIPVFPEVNQTSYTMDTESVSGVSQTERGFDHPPPSRSEVKEILGLYLYFSRPSWPVVG
jgi:hypothetical protein